MENYLLAGLGIFVSVFLFLVGYRQTIGAKKERIIAANSEIEKIILRRVVLEKYNPSVVDLSRLLEGKARDFRVKINDLLSEGQILNCLFTRIIETDLIAPNQREEILSRLITILDEAENAPVNESYVMDVDNTSARKIFIKIAVPLFMGLVASIMGSFIAFLPQAGSNSLELRNITNLLVVTTTVSMILIMTLYLFKRLKESQQDVDIPSRSKSIEKAINFEKEVSKIIDKYGVKYKASGLQDRGYDFEIIVKDKPVLIEVKAWTMPAPRQLIARIVQRLSDSVREVNALKGIIVTKMPIDFGNVETEGSNVEAMSLNQFRNFLKNNK